MELSNKGYITKTREQRWNHVRLNTTFEDKEAEFQKEGNFVIAVVEMDEDRGTSDFIAAEKIAFGKFKAIGMWVYFVLLFTVHENVKSRVEPDMQVSSRISICLDLLRLANFIEGCIGMHVFQRETIRAFGRSEDKPLRFGTSGGACLELCVPVRVSPSSCCWLYLRVSVDLAKLAEFVFRCCVDWLKIIKWY